MAGAKRASIVLGAVIGWLLAAGSASAAGPSVIDRAGLFSRSARERAVAHARDIERRYGVALVIESFSSGPTLGKVAGYLRGPEAREAYQEGWVRRMAAGRAGAHGIYVSLCADPPPLRVRIVAGAGIRHIFPLRDEGRLAAMLERSHGDEGLLAAVGFVQSTLQAALGVGVIPPEPFPWGAILGIVFVALSVWGLLESVRRFIRDGETGAVSGETGGYGNGGGQSVALFAAMTRPWLSDLLAGLRAPPASAPATDAQTPDRPAGSVDPMPAPYAEPHTVLEGDGWPDAVGTARARGPQE